MTERAKIIAFANQKGGVAKTTTTLNLAAAFAEEGHRVLCVDMDPQGNLTMSQGIDPDSLEQSMYDVLVHRISIREVVRKREIDVACASIDLAGAEIAMAPMIGRERALQRALPPDHGRHRDLGSGEIDRGARDVDLPLADHLPDRDSMHEDVVHRLLERVGIDPLRHREVALRVHVHAEDAMALLRERGREVERRRGLGDAALLICKGDDLRPFGHGRLARRVHTHTRPYSQDLATILHARCRVD